ncbi:MAG: sugar ABC transporter ATP-binding protein [Firmicutes bacterium]|nr:sugar ABC transporter ATP-binding protein [Bacillota bacterium]MDH7495719.1 sugar ABC transporter ATP-binding protein [Bacillota bacterium]
MQGITKVFPGVVALNNVSLEVRRGEIHALVGENGAGKSTLMNILGGVIQPDSGRILINGTETSIPDPRAAQNVGISFIHQELALFPDMPVVSNLFIEAFQNGRGILNWKRLRSETEEVLSRIGLNVSPTATVRSLRMGERQMIEIARALLRNTKVLVLDEPTSSLTERETKVLFGLMRELASRGVSIVYISHRLDEIFEVCNRATVLRDGQKVGTVDIASTAKMELIRMIVGRDLREMFPKSNVPMNQELLRVEGLTRRGVFEDISFALKAGEIVGITGLMGSGRTELARAIFGLDPVDSGKVKVLGRPISIRGPEDAIRNGFGFVTEDRRNEGFIADKPIRMNIVLASLHKFTKWGWWVDEKAQERAAERQISNLRIATPDSRRWVKYLSGGNQQKVVIGKWLEAEPKIFILDEPTRGVDVGAKAEIHEIMNGLAQKGAAILMISSELQEVLGMSDRILVMRNGRLIADLKRDEATQEAVLALETGGDR